ncbi:MAG: HesA/MoeB/ThiF family protein [Planctomycetota bacterium]
MSSDANISYDFDRQLAFAEWGPAAQDTLGRSRVLIVGAGGLGSWMIELLARAGVGSLRLADDDVVTATNLHRQAMYTPAQAADGVKKVDAAADTIERINPTVRVEGCPVRFTPDTADELTDEVDIILDGTDNFPTRFTINDQAVKRAIPWVFAGAAAAQGQVMAVLPGRTACLRCLYETPPPKNMEITAQTVGVINPIVAAVSSIAVAQAMRILAAAGGAAPCLLRLDVWNAVAQRLTATRRTDCPCCSRREFDYLERAR